MRDTELCKKLLVLQEPWSISRVRVDVQSQELHAYLTTGKPWFGRSPFEQHKWRWRHVNVGAYKTYIHATLPDEGGIANEPLPFLGRVGKDYTHGLARRVIDCLQAGLGYRQVCELLGIDVYLAWQIRHGISEGQFPGADDKLAARMSAEEGTELAQQSIPATGDPVWFNLLESEQPFHANMLGLKLLLARTRQEFSGLTSEDAKIIRVNAIRRFFIRHEKQLSDEIAQLDKFRDQPEAASYE
ncbi:hypothetical protein ACQUWM_14705 [Marinobacter sp. DUT-3]|uniref:hypothetical protein n=1 Tax=Marinobacter sp. DUT-3 TaxID=3412036 RepID=UPI003D1743A4